MMQLFVMQIVPIHCGDYVDGPEPTMTTWLVVTQPHTNELGIATSRRMPYNCTMNSRGQLVIRCSMTIESLYYLRHMFHIVIRGFVFHVTLSMEQDMVLHMTAPSYSKQSYARKECKAREIIETNSVKLKMRKTTNPSQNEHPHENPRTGSDNQHVMKGSYMGQSPQSLVH
jgi:hypothetical protein